MQWLTRGSTGCEFDSHWNHCFNSLMALGKLQAAYHNCAPAQPRAKMVSGLRHFLLGCAWNNCCSSNRSHAPWGVLKCIRSIRKTGGGGIVKLCKTCPMLR